MTDFDFDDDDALDDDLDFEGPDPTEDQLQKVEAFNQQVKRNIGILTTKRFPEDQRIAAAEWLGDSGAPEAIKALRVIYYKETNKKIKKAAEYALGQFKALDEAILRDMGEPVAEALSREENASVVRLLEQITLEGKTGSRKSPSPEVMNRIAMILGGVFVLLLVANMAVLGPLAGDDNQATRTPTPPAIAQEDQVALGALAALRRGVVTMNNNTALLTDQFNAAREGNALDCVLEPEFMPETFRLPDPVISRYPTTEVLVTRATSALGSITEVIRIRTRVCDRGTPPTAGEFDQVDAALAAANASLDGLAESIQTTEDNILTTATANQAATAAASSGQNAPEANTTPGAEVTEAPVLPTETPTNTVEPTATLDPEQINVHIRALSNQIADITAQRGSFGQLNQYWQDVSIGGQTAGCTAVQPAIPEDYREIPAEVLAVEPRLGTARENFNTALALMREGWALFRNACDTNSLVNQLNTGLTITQTASGAFTSAQEILRDLSQR